MILENCRDALLHIALVHLGFYFSSAFNKTWTHGHSKRSELPYHLSTDRGGWRSKAVGIDGDAVAAAGAMGEGDMEKEEQGGIAVRARFGLGCFLACLTNQMKNYRSEFPPIRIEESHSPRYTRHFP